METSYDGIFTTIHLSGAAGDPVAGKSAGFRAGSLAAGAVLPVPVPGKGPGELGLCDPVQWCAV